MKIILDGMGGDNAPTDIVLGAVLASREADTEIILAGNEDIIKAELALHKYDKNKISILPTTEVITSAEAPVKAIKTKKDSSIVRGMQEVNEGRADLFISAGNSGALLAGGIFLIGRIQGIDRPALGSTYPVLGKGVSLLVDAGANTDVKPRNLLQFAYMGSIYMSAVLGCESPRVGLVNLGSEPEKGSKLLKDSYELLEKSSQDGLIKFIGNIEGREVPRMGADVIVCDGLVGNVILKLTEGLALNIWDLLKTKMLSNLKSKIAASLLKPQLISIKKEFDYSEYGGAPFLGIKKPIIKIHGSADAKNVKNGIIKAMAYVENNVVETIASHIDELKQIEDVLEKEALEKEIN
jgi:glycerol-3-phosphate acyltransferase PlsX